MNRDCRPEGPIIEELGGGRRAESSVGAAVSPLLALARGEERIVQTNGYANIVFARGLRGCLCAARIGWDEEGWLVDPIALDDPLASNGKHQVFGPAGDWPCRG